MSRSAPLSLALLALTVAVSGARGQDPAARRSPSQAQPGAGVVVAANTTIPLQLRTTVNSRTAFAGQPIYAETIYPVTANDRILIPAGSYVKGEITEVVRPGRVKGRAKVGLRFNSLTLPNGVTRPLRATLTGFGTTGREGFDKREGKVQGDSSKGEDAGRVLTTTSEGAIIGGLASRSASGGALGAAGGGLGGLIWVLASRGKEVVLPPGTDLNMQLIQPLILPNP